MDFNKEFAAHQLALMRADTSAHKEDSLAHLAQASSIADRIGAVQRQRGIVAAFAGYMPQVSAPAGA